MALCSSQVLRANSYASGDSLHWAKSAHLIQIKAIDCLGGKQVARGWGQYRVRRKPTGRRRFRGLGHTARTDARHDEHNHFHSPYGSAVAGAEALLHEDAAAHENGDAPAYKIVRKIVEKDDCYSRLLPGERPPCFHRHGRGVAEG
jgi:hypothetical protein